MGRMRVGFHASHEQIAPSRLLSDLEHAERAGFEMAMCSDHFGPWSARQGHSGYAWAWLGAALARTDLELGCVCAPGQRYHPAVVAQKIATLGEMFPGRFWTALGSGENSNEHITGDRWPRKEVRTARLEECVDVIRRLLDGEEVTHDGLVTVDRARVWERADPVPLLIAPAVTVATARAAADWADGLVTSNQPHEHLREMVAAYREAGEVADAVTVPVHERLDVQAVDDGGLPPEVAGVGDPHTATACSGATTSNWGSTCSPNASRKPRCSWPTWCR